MLSSTPSSLMSSLAPSSPMSGASPQPPIAHAQGADSGNSFAAHLQQVREQSAPAAPPPADAPKAARGDKTGQPANTDKSDRGDKAGKAEQRDKSHDDTDAGDGTTADAAQTTAPATDNAQAPTAPLHGHAHAHGTAPDATVPADTAQAAAAKTDPTLLGTAERGVKRLGGSSAPGGKASVKGRDTLSAARGTAADARVANDADAGASARFKAALAAAGERGDAGAAGEPSATAGRAGLAEVGALASTVAGGDANAALPLPSPGAASLSNTAASAAATPAPAFEGQLSAPFGTPEFAPALGVQLTVLAREGVQEARLHLNPADMGPIAVQIALDGSNAIVHFQADVAATRQALENSLPDLASAMRDGGFTLSGGSVSQQSAGRQGDGTERGTDGNAAGGVRGVNGAAGTADDTLAGRGTAARALRPQGVVDLYA